MKKVMLVNQGMSNNLGDKLINYAISSYLKARDFEVLNAGYTCFSEMQIEDTNFLEYRAEKKLDLPVSMKWNLKKRQETKNYINKFKEQYDYLIIGGGQLLKTCCYFPYALNEWINFGKRSAKKIFLIGIGVDQSFSIVEKKIYDKCLRQCDVIVVRDMFSQQCLSNIFGVSSKLLPDLAFLCNESLRFKTLYERFPLIMPFDFDTYRYHFNNSLSLIDYRLKWKYCIDKELSFYNKIVFAYTTPEDKKECFLLKKFLGESYKNNIIINNTDSVNNLIDSISNATIVYTSRMHAMIIALMLKKDIRCITISKKTAQFADEYLCKKISSEKLYKILKSSLDEII